MARSGRWCPDCARLPKDERDECQAVRNAEKMLRRPRMPVMNRLSASPYAAVRALTEAVWAARSLRRAMLRFERSLPRAAQEGQRSREVPDEVAAWHPHPAAAGVPPDAAPMPLESCFEAEDLLVPDDRDDDDEPVALPGRYLPFAGDG